MKAYKFVTTMTRESGTKTVESSLFRTKRAAESLGKDPIIVLLQKLESLYHIDVKCKVEEVDVNLFTWLFKCV